MFRRTPRTRDEATPTTPSPSERAPAPLVEVNDANFLDQTAGPVTVVDFWAPWCGPCRAFAPIFEEAAGDYAGRVRFGKCDVDTSPQTAALLQIQSIPTLIVFGPDGSELTRAMGAIPRRKLDTILEPFAPSTP